jgi:hypothetical protein
MIINLWLLDNTFDYKPNSFSKKLLAKLLIKDYKVCLLTYVKCFINWTRESIFFFDISSDTILVQYHCLLQKCAKVHNELLSSRWYKTYLDCLVWSRLEEDMIWGAELAKTGLAGFYNHPDRVSQSCENYRSLWAEAMGMTHALQFWPGPGTTRNDSRHACVSTARWKDRAWAAPLARPD